MRRALDKLIWVVLILLVSAVIYTMSGRSDDESQELPWFSWVQPQTIHGGGGNTPPPSGPALLDADDDSGVRFAAP